MTPAPDSETHAAHQVTLAGMGVNALNAISKILVGIAANSSALLADGIHSLSDLFSDLLVLGATHFGRRKADQNHPYGHDRYETLATLLLGALMIAVAGALVWDSLMRLLAPGEAATPGLLALVVAALSVLSKEWIYRYTLRVARRINSRLLEANAWNHRSDALSSIVVLVALTGVLLGYPWLDQLAAVIVGVLVARVSVQMIWNSLKELVDTALPDEEQQQIRDIALSVPGVQDLHHLRTRTMGSRSLLDIHLQVSPQVSVSEGHEISVWVAHKLLEQFSHLSDVTVHIDPENDARTAQPKPLLPLRPEVLEQLHQCWHDDPGYTRPDQATLHYLDAGIDVDLFYTADQLQTDQITALEARLQAQAAHLPWLRRIRIWVGRNPA